MRRRRYWFTKNKGSRAVILEPLFRAIKLRDYPNMTSYCDRLKTLSDQLSDIGALVSNQRLVLHLCCSLTEAYNGVVPLIEHKDPLPPFAQARMANRAFDDESLPNDALHRGDRGGEEGKGGGGSGRSKGSWKRRQCRWPEFLESSRPQAHAAFLAPSSGYGPVNTPTDIDQAMHTLTLSPPDDQCYMDTGQHEYMTGNQDVSYEVGMKIEDVPIVNEFMDVFPSEIAVNKEVSLFVEGSESMLMMKEAKNEDETYDMYNEYAFSKGFGIRVGKGRKHQNSELYTMKRFLCSCEGVKDEKRKRTRSYARLDTLPLNKRHLIRSQRKVSKEALYFMSTLKASGVKVSDTLRVLRKEVGGSPMVGFTASDAYNALSRAKANKLEGHDCHQLIKYFAQRNSSEEGFYYDFELSEEDGLLSFFWRDGRMKRDYDYFGDLLVFDTTYRTNKYDMICAPFVGMNHHANNVMFGMGFVINEKTESFNWLFQTFLTSMGGNPPITIMTDQAPSIVAGIRNVFPDARHRLCTWHIGENSKKHIGQYRALDGFCDIFNYLLKYCETAAEFEYHWPRMLTHYKCVENPWLKNLYTIREMWCPAYSKNYWSGGVLSSQRCEITHKSVSHRLDKTQGLCDFYHVFLDVISEWRSKENGHDYRNWKGRPEVAAANCGILLHARKIYTIEAYVLFEEQFLKGMACSQEEKRENTATEKSYYVWRP
ncbi:protein FAR1-RELATED SEQUENCE 5-like [Spinacia oleracea]|uniref:Protein FAR1-RELATED SEQUENCE 5-like n=1 Tax=Spinacia oleracea TaxID=3562 RepID=A0ABM3R970_SPIOL|nr:protein FAR1-RELATED SEQUENCE 5-like [Spinacia oleracea]